jgi:hypothetical protein
MGTTIRPFNAIDGIELMELVLKDIRRQMEQDYHFRRNTAYPMFAYNFKMAINVYPSEPQNWEFSAKGQHKTDPSFEPTPEGVVEIDFDNQKMVAAPQGQTVDSARREAGIPVTAPKRTAGPDGSRVTVDAPQVDLTKANQPQVTTEEPKSQTNVQREGGKVFARSVTQRTAAAPHGVEAAPQQGSRPSDADAEEIINREKNAPQE